MLWQKYGLAFMASLYYVAGFTHLLFPQLYKPLMPTWVFLPDEAIFYSGLLEIILATLLLIKRTRVLAAYLIIAMLIIYLPIHVQHVDDCLEAEHSHWWLIAVRIPVQFLLMRWAWKYTSPVENTPLVRKANS